MLRSTDGGAHWSIVPPGAGEMSAAERFSRLFARRKNWFALAIALATGFFAWQMRHLEIYTQFLDLLPRNHAFIRTYEGYREVYGNANTVVAAVVAKDGDIYQPEVLRAVAALTAKLDSSVVPAEVNAFPASHYVDAQLVDRPRGTRAGGARRPRCSAPAATARPRPASTTTWSRA